MKTIWQMIKLKVINNRKLWICCLCIVAMALLCFLSPFPSGDPDEKETVLKVWLNIDREQLLKWQVFILWPRDFETWSGLLCCCHL